MAHLDLVNLLKDHFDQFKIQNRDSTKVKWQLVQTFFTTSQIHQFPNHLNDDLHLGKHRLNESDLNVKIKPRPKITSETIEPRFLFNCFLKDTPEVTLQTTEMIRDFLNNTQVSKPKRYDYFETFHLTTKDLYEMRGKLLQKLFSFRSKSSNIDQKHEAMKEFDLRFRIISKSSFYEYVARDSKISFKESKYSQNLSTFNLRSNVGL
jgi:hypothetical protein